MNSDREKVCAKVLEIEDRKTVATLHLRLFIFVFFLLCFDNLFVGIFCVTLFDPVHCLMPFFVIA